jgi:hypothetical protein
MIGEKSSRLYIVIKALYIIQKIRFERHLTHPDGLNSVSDFGKTEIQQLHTLCVFVSVRVCVCAARKRAES